MKTKEKILEKYKRYIITVDNEINISILLSDVREAMEEYASQVPTLPEAEHKAVIDNPNVLDESNWHNYFNGFMACYNWMLERMKQ